MGQVRVSGQLVCKDDAEAAVVREHAPLHAELSRAEAGCVSFEFGPTDDPLVWQVDEVWADADAFQAHRDRTAASEWSRVSAGLERRLAVDGLP